MQQLKPLTSLRFFAAAAIVVSHLFATARLGHAEALALGVSFFFVLSGFILTYVYGSFERSSFRAFYIARIARIWPIHLLTFAACVLLFTANQEPWKTGFLNVLLLQAWAPFNGYVFSYNGVSWSVSAEVFFYLLFPFLACTRNFGRWFVAIFLILFAYLTALSFMHFNTSSAWGAVRLSSLGHHLPVTRFPEFALGVGSAKLFLAIASSPPKLIRDRSDELFVVGLAALAVFILTMPIVHASIPSAFYAWYGQSGCQLVFAALIFVAAFGHGRVRAILSNRFLVMLGEISFVTYMVHTIVMRWVYLNFFKSFGMAFYVVASLAGAYIVSYFLHYGFEEPVRRWIVSRSKPNQRRYSYRPHGETLKSVPVPDVLPGK